MTNKMNSKTTNKRKSNSKNQNRLMELFDKLKIIVLKFFKKNWQLILMNIIIFILTVFIESIYIYNLKFLLWVFNTFLFVLIPTIIFTLKFKIKSKDIILSIPMLYILFLLFLDFCTLRDLYGITKGSLDTIPSFIDALLVVFIFVFFEYMGCFITNQIMNKRLLKRKK